MENIFALKLKELREKNAYSLQDLADKIGVSKQSIHKFENGIVNASSETVLKLSEVFNVPYFYFFDNPEAFSFSFENIRFRDGHTILNRDLVEAEIKAKVIDNVSKYMELEDILGIEHHFENPLSEFQIISEKDIEKAAKIMRKKWKLGNDPIMDVIEMLEDKGVFIVELELAESFSGLSGMLNESLPIIVLNENVTSKERKRFTALHELGHIVLEFAENFSDEKVETFCHHFAGAVLLVDEVLFGELGKNRTTISLNELRRIKERYGISIQAIIVRARAANFINYGTFVEWKQVYDEWKQSGIKANDFGEFRCKEKPARFNNMIMQGLTEKKISLSKAAELSRTKIDLLEMQMNMLQFNVRN